MDTKNKKVRDSEEIHKAEEVADEAPGVDHADGKNIEQRNDYRAAKGKEDPRGGLPRLVVVPQPHPWVDFSCDALEQDYICFLLIASP